MKFGMKVQKDLDAIILNPIAPVIINHWGLNLLGEPCSVVGLPCLYSVVTMETKMYQRQWNQIKLNS
jgi:hypothetical protein